MALAAWKQANEITRQEAEEDDAQAAALLPSALKRFRASLGIACTAGLATNYPKKGPHECFLSVCQARGSTLLRPQCETYHLQLDKTLGRSRTEEDHIVSRWLVYLLAKAADVDVETCGAFRDELLAAQTGSDALVKLTSDEEDASDSDPLLDICSGKSSQLMGVAFLPENANGKVEAAAGAAMTTTATRDFDFRGLILPGSFNPLHKGHVDLARVAQQVLKSQTGVELPVAFELAVSNADKGAIESATIAKRVVQFSHDNTLGLGAWPVLVTNATLFGQKAELLPGCAFVIGADTAVRIVDKKYYDMDEHKMVLALDHIARKNCSFVVAGRFDNKVENRFISAEEVLEKSVPSVFRHLFVPLPESAFRNDISSTELRRQMATQ